MQLLDISLLFSLYNNISMHLHMKRTVSLATTNFNYHEPTLKRVYNFDMTMVLQVVVMLNAHDRWALISL